MKSSEGQADARLTTLVARNAQSRSNDTAVTDENGGVTWRMFAQQVEGLSAHLAALGVGRGTKVALWWPTGRDYLLAIFAVARRGAASVHVNTRFGVTEVGDLLERSGAAVLVTRTSFATVDFLHLLGEVPGDKLAQLRTVLCFGPAPATVAGLPIESPRFEGNAPDLSRPDDPCLTYTTGGTASCCWRAPRRSSSASARWTG